MRRPGALPPPPADLFVPRGRSPYEGEGEAAAAAAAAARTEAAEVAEASATAAAPPPAKRRGQTGHAPFPAAVDGEMHARITVRGVDGMRTAEYRALLRDLGKPGDG